MNSEDFKRQAEHIYDLVEHGKMNEAAKVIESIYFKTPLPELDRLFPAVLYFEDEASRDAFVEDVKKAKPTWTAKRL